MKLEGAVFLVTGGSSGLGAATVQRFHAAGAYVVICNRDDAKGEALAAKLGARARFVRTDVTLEQDAQQAVDIAQGEFGALHGLINCAGVAVPGRVVGEAGPLKLDLFTRCVQVNLIGSFNMIRVAAAAMYRNEATPGGERGIIVNTSSIVAYEGQVGQAGYAAANAGIIGMTFPIALELASKGVRVMTIAPGPFLTERLRPAPVERLRSLGRASPFPPRLGMPDEYASLAQHIVENEMLNGETIRLDGATRLDAMRELVSVSA